MKYILCFVVIIVGVPGFSQMQTCPSNINFNTGDLSNWAVTTGLMAGPTQSYPAPNTGLTTVPEYTISNTGISVITSPGQDPFGFFTTIPTINGYAYNYSIKLGSTATSHDLNSQSRNPGGFTRAITYNIDVPAGSPTVPYTMTYAYAMVLENGTHNSNEQPLFKATLTANGNVITCASPQYYLPTFNNAGGGNGGSGTGATLDTATALKNGFSNSPTPFFSYSGGTGGTGQNLYDVWTKGWTEVTFDLSPYRGQTVTLTFESDNCRPGAHFAYAYVALRNQCAGLQISGETIACTNSTLEYSVPALAGATYSWQVPAGWTINSGANTNIINVTVGAGGGKVINNEVNGCANLFDTIDVNTTPPTVPGQTQHDTVVCSGVNSSPLSVTGEVGNVLKWVSSSDGGVTWRDIAVTTKNYTAQNLTATTRFAALVQNGPTCRIDTSAAAVVTVDPRTIGGRLDPALINVCMNEVTDHTFTLRSYIGAVVNWQLSYDNANWNNFAPANNNDSYVISGGINKTAYYRTIVKSGVCPTDTSAVASIKYFSVPISVARIDPGSASLCYGKSTELNAIITTGTSYAWSSIYPLTPGGSGAVPSLPYNMTETIKPLATTDVVLTVFNTGCPNALKDTFHIDVTKPIIVQAGNDTAVVVNQPLQLNATVNDPNASIWSWTPATGLNFSSIPDPLATYDLNAPAAITYIVTAKTIAGCSGADTITVKIFKTPADIFVPSGFTPNADGRNDVIRPILVGVKQLNFFRVYNRWGQLVFSTSEIGKGWDGTLGGSKQATDNFVYMVQAVDYTGKTIVKRGNFVLIR